MIDRCENLIHRRKALAKLCLPNCVRQADRQKLAQTHGLAVGRPGLVQEKKEGKVLLSIDAMATTTTTPSASQTAPTTKPKVEADESNFHRIRITLSSTKLEALEKGAKIFQKKLIMRSVR
jgi:hypothetical protein